MVGDHGEDPEGAGLHAHLPCCLRNGSDYAACVRHMWASALLFGYAGFSCSKHYPWAPISMPVLALSSQNFFIDKKA